jgi:3-hydroxyisobutyrate dehydrogenase-like beta-hydroxyacid dehydrogenase
MKIGFIGLGNMGSGMAASLLKAGHGITVYNRTPEKAKPLVEKGARKAASLADACNGDVVITMLADDSAVENVSFGDAAIINNLAKGAIHVSSSTISVGAGRQTDGRARETWAAVCVGAGVWTSGSGGERKIVHCRGGSGRCSGCMYGFV